MNHVEQRREVELMEAELPTYSPAREDKRLDR